MSRLKSSVASSGDLPDSIHFSGFIAPQRQPRPRANILRSRKAGQSNNWTDTRKCIWSLRLQLIINTDMKHGCWGRHG